MLGPEFRLLKRSSCIDGCELADKKKAYVSVVWHDARYQE